MSAAPETVPPAGGVPEPAGDTRGADLRRLVGDNPAIVLTFVFVGLYIATDIVNRAQSGKAFLTPTSVSTTFLYAAVLGLLAAGQTLVMLTGGVDLSVATTATASAFLVSRFGTHDAAFAIAVALLCGLVIGLVNGVGVAIFRVNALIMTLGVSVITLGILTVQAQKQFTALVPHFVVVIGSQRFLRYIPYDLLLWAPIAALIILGLRYSGIGRMIYAVGDNPVAARLAGVRVWQVQLFVYAACGVLSALAGTLLVGFNNAADLGIASNLLLPSVAAVVIGGTSIFGGFGGYAGTILGALILTVLDSLLVILNASQAVRQMLYGFIVLALAAIYARSTSS
jgi:ribose transport system permease protein